MHSQACSPACCMWGNAPSTESVSVSDQAVMLPLNTNNLTKFNLFLYPLSCSDVFTEGLLCIQDALDLIEFVSGPAESEWGSLRAKMGHPQPWQLNYFAIGNEVSSTLLHCYIVALLHCCIVALLHCYIVTMRPAVHCLPELHCCAPFMPSAMRSALLHCCRAACCIQPASTLLLCTSHAMSNEVSFTMLPCLLLYTACLHSAAAYFTAWSHWAQTRLSR